MKKLCTLLLISLLSLSLFAQGAIEMSNTERPVKVLEVIATADNSYDFLVMEQNGNQILYHTSADKTTSSFPLQYIQKGDVLAITDNGIATMSLPSQMFATNIRYITLGAGYYGLSFPAEVAQVGVVTPEVAFWDVQIADEMLPRFSYSYGYLSIENFKGQGLTLKGSYFAKGILDFYSEAEPLIGIDEMDPIIEQYITEIYSQGIVHDTGATYGSIDTIKELTVPESLEERFSYCYGFMIAAQLTYNGIEVVPQPFVEGVLTSIYSLAPIFTQEKMDASITEYSEYLNAKYQEMFAQLQQANLETANAFLADNKTKEGVITLDSGVQYEIINKGDGAKPTPADTIVVNYTLHLLNGTILDQGSDVTFTLGSLIPGFIEVATKMQVGEAVTAYIPPSLGYGENGTENIEPNSLLIFDIELKEIVK